MGSVTDIWSGKVVVHTIAI